MKRILLLLFALSPSASAMNLRPVISDMVEDRRLPPLLAPVAVSPENWTSADPDDGHVYWLDKTNNRIIRWDARRPPPFDFNLFRSGHLDGAASMELPEGLAQSPGAAFAVRDGTVYFWDRTGPRLKLP